MLLVISTVAFSKEPIMMGINRVWIWLVGGLLLLMTLVVLAWGMLDVAQSGDYAGKNLLAILADTGERYLSTDVWN